MIVAGRLASVMRHDIQDTIEPEADPVQNEWLELQNAKIYLRDTSTLG